MLDPAEAALVVIDIQGKLSELMFEKEAVYGNASRLIRGAAVLELPILWTEQYPEGLGPTRPELADLLPGEPITKIAFDCCGEPAFVSALELTGRRQILLCGIEAHICIYQTAAGLTERGYTPFVVADAVSSRTPRNRRLGIQCSKDAGAVITGVEMALFQMLGIAGTDAFKQVVRIVK
jgi:nicotinamidase-related amidase